MHATGHVDDDRERERETHTHTHTCARVYG